ncbi:hypothetical protein BGX29_002372 [Mortierella sp. GBA35]|nr:hypothetical protein BGX23_004791 [Mortierella sp. AD031]KAF9108229.1 hypothetical protein BGX29_002372 [Mortierella sp. GBA35]KAG0208321.1 hypothetical protein BGX33_006327 [Mortierella sp. NVP41]
MSTPSVTASYSVSTPSADTTSSAGQPILAFESPIDATYNATTTPDQSQKEEYLTALAKALSTLQESINTGLTERLVQQGVLADKGDNPVDVKNKVRTKVPGQPNNSKKGQTKKQQLREQQEQEQKDKQSAAAATATEATTASTTELAQGSTTTATPGIEVISLKFNPTPDSAMDVDPTPPTAALETSSTSTEPLDLEDQYKPKGGIYGSDDEDEDATAKDEVDLVMEADPGEIDGACLELPKEQDALAAAAPAQTKKRNELPLELAGQDAAATKKSRGSEA